MRFFPKAIEALSKHCRCSSVIFKVSFCYNAPWALSYKSGKNAIKLYPRADPEINKGERVPDSHILSYAQILCLKSRGKGFPTNETALWIQLPGNLVLLQINRMMRNSIKVVINGVKLFKTVQLVSVNKCLHNISI